METIKVKNVIIGEGMPKICVPLVPEKLEQLSAEAAMARESGCDIVEWRLDRLRKWTDKYCYHPKSRCWLRRMVFPCYRTCRFRVS